MEIKIGKFYKLVLKENGFFSKCCDLQKIDGQIVQVFACGYDDGNYRIKSKNDTTHVCEATDLQEIKEGECDMLRELKVKDLKTGMVTVSSFGDVGIVLLNTDGKGENNYIIYRGRSGQIFSNDKEMDMSKYISKLYVTLDGYPHYVINEATKIQKYSPEELKNDNKFTLIYDKDFVKEVTMAQIEEIFGAKVKIIG